MINYYYYFFSGCWFKGVRRIHWILSRLGSISSVSVGLETTREWRNPMSNSQNRSRQMRVRWWIFSQTTLSQISFSTNFKGWDDLHLVCWCWKTNTSWFATLCWQRSQGFFNRWEFCSIFIVVQFHFEGTTSFWFLSPEKNYALLSQLRNWENLLTVGTESVDYPKVSWLARWSVESNETGEKRVLKGWYHFRNFSVLTKKYTITG